MQEDPRKHIPPGFAGNQITLLQSSRRTALSRRDFLQMIALTGGISLVSPFLNACSTEGLPADSKAPMQPTQGKPTVSAATPSLTQADSAKFDPARVAFVKTRDRAEGVRKAVDLLGDNPVSGKRVFLKPNFNSADPAPGSTHPDVLRALVLKLQELGAAAISLGDRSGMGNTREVMRRIGVFELAQELGFETVVFDELGTEDWVMVQPPDCHWVDGFPFARPCLEAEALVQVCCLKTHQYGGHFTMSLKNSVGMVAKKVPGNPYNFMNELHDSMLQRAMIAEINLAYTPALIVLDGVYAFISRGPAEGELVAAEVVLAGTDRIAIDAVGVALLRHFGNKTEVAEGPIFQQDQIARAVALGLGIDSPEKIEFITGDPDSAAYAESIKEILLDG
jgi:uncharacterized protein (DUF362 family)